MSDVKEMTTIQQILDGATIPDATNHLVEILTISMMVPMGDPRLLYLDADGHPMPLNEKRVKQVNPNAKCKMGIVPMLHGLSGTAKSAVVTQVATRLGLPCETIFPGTRQPEDFSDLPVVLNNELAAACMLAPVNTLNELGGGVLFLDETSCAPESVQGAMLGMVLTRRVGSTEIHPLVRILAAGNPPKYAAGGWALAAPFANRLAHFYVSKPPKDRLIDWIVNGTNATDSTDSMMDLLVVNWGAAWAHASSMWVGFLTSPVGDTSRQNQPEPGNPQAGYSWASDRSWEMAFRTMATIKALDRKEYDHLIPTFFEACVGQGATRVFLEWMTKADLPDTLEALTNGWTVDKKRLDKVMAVYTGMSNLVNSVPDTDTKQKHHLATLMWKRIEALADAGMPDMALRFAKPLTNTNLGYVNAKLPQTLRDAAAAAMMKFKDSKVAKSGLGRP